MSGSYRFNHAQNSWYNVNKLHLPDHDYTNNANSWYSQSDPGVKNGERKSGMVSGGLVYYDNATYSGPHTNKGSFARGGSDEHSDGMDVTEAPYSPCSTLKRKRIASETTPEIQGPVATIEIKGKSEVEYGKTASFEAKCNIGSLDASHFTVKWQRIDKGKVNDLDLSLDKFNGSSTDLKNARLIIKDIMTADTGTYQLLLCKDNHYTSSQCVLNVHMKLDKKMMRYKHLNKKGTDALRYYFDAHVSPSKLSTHLATYQSVMESKWHCNQHQMRIMFPVGKVVSSNAFDTSLLYKLCRNSLGIDQPKKGWNCLPNQGDISEGDDIERINQYRNKVSHMGQGELKNFEQEFTDLSEAIVRLGGKIFKPEVKRVKNLKIDNVENIRIQNIEATTSQLLKILQSMEKKTEETRTRKSSRKDAPCLLCELYRHRVCHECSGKLDRPIKPPKDFDFRRHTW